MGQVSYKIELATLQTSCNMSKDSATLRDPFLDKLARRTRHSSGVRPNSDLACSDINDNKTE